MKVRHLTLAAIAPAMLLCSCYTVLKAPYSASSGYDESRYAPEEVTSPQVGRFHNAGDGYRDPYGSYGPGAYGRPAYPVFGYDSTYGGFGGFGSGYGGYSPYSSGYGPYGYGYDPYYGGDGSAYVPPGYRLVTVQELDRLRATEAASTNTQIPTADPAEIHRQQIEDSQNAWSSRVHSIERRTKPQPTKRVQASSSSTKSTTTGASKSTVASSKDQEKPSGKAKAKSRQKRR